MIHSSSSRAGYTDLMSQLEESKFLRLFRFLATNAIDTGRASAPEALALKDAELQVVTVAGDRWSTAQNLFFQLGYLPISCWHTSNVEFLIESTLTAAFNCLKQRPDLISTLEGATMARATRECGWPTHWSGISSYYLYVTNVCDPAILNEDCQRYTEIAHDLFKTIVGSERHLHPHFGIGNPNIFTDQTPLEVERFMVELINSPSSYYLIAREGRISIAPVTEHGRYATRGSPQSASQQAHQFATVTNTLSQSSQKSSATLAQFETLLNTTDIREKDIQHFLKSNPEILFSLDDRYCELRPHICLYDSTGNKLIPDFMVRLETADSWNLIELKMPRDVISVKYQATDRPSAQAARGIAELLRYRDVLSTRASRSSLTSKLGIGTYEPCLVLVIGRGSPTRRLTWNGKMAGLPTVDIVSYDYLFQRAMNCRRLLKPESPSSIAGAPSQPILPGVGVAGGKGPLTRAAEDAIATAARED